MPIIFGALSEGCGCFKPQYFSSCFFSILSVLEIPPSTMLNVLDSSVSALREDSTPNSDPETSRNRQWGKLSYFVSFTVRRVRPVWQAENDWTAVSDREAAERESCRWTSPLGLEMGLQESEGVQDCWGLLASAPSGILASAKRRVDLRAVV